MDSDELLRRLQRARAHAELEERNWRARGEESRNTDPEAARVAGMRATAYEAVGRVLDEVLRPGERH